MYDKIHYTHTKKENTMIKFPEIKKKKKKNKELINKKKKK